MYLHSPRRELKKFLLPALFCGAINIILIMQFNPKAIIGCIACWLAFSLCMKLLICNIREKNIRMDCVLIYIIANSFISFLSIVPMIANKFRFGDFNTNRPDTIYFFENALLFAQMGKLTYSLLDVLGGVMIYLYGKFGLKSDVMCLVPINWGCYSLLMVITYLFVYRITGAIGNINLFLAVSALNYELLDVSTIYLRDVLGVMLFLLSVYYFSEKNLYLGFFNSILAFFVRGGNGFLSFLAYPFLHFANVWKNRKGTIIILTLCVLVTGSYLSNYLGKYAGSSILSLKINNKKDYNFSENRERLMERGIVSAEKRGRVDMTNTFYRLGPRGLPLRYITNMFAPVRARKLWDYRRKKGRSSALVYGVWPEAVYSYLYILSLPFFTPYLIYGLYCSYRINRYVPWLLFFLVVLSMIVLYSLQERHRLMFIIFYPLFVEIGIKQIKSNRLKNRMKTVVLALILLIYLPNLYLLTY